MLRLAVHDQFRSWIQLPAHIEANGADRRLIPQTWADGLLTGLGAPNFAILQQGRVRVVTVGEQAIVEAARFCLERMKLVVEPSSATVLAALRAIAPELRGRRIGAIFSGGNTDFRWLAR